MIGYAFMPAPEINGTKIIWVYINDLKGWLPGMLVHFLANRMQKKGFTDMNLAMKLYKSGDLNLDDSKADILFSSPSESDIGLKQQK